MHIWDPSRAISFLVAYFTQFHMKKFFQMPTIKDSAIRIPLECSKTVIQNTGTDANAAKTLG